MTFQRLQMNRVIRAVAIIALLGTVLSGCGCYAWMLSEVMPHVDTNADPSEQQTQLQNELEPLLREIYEEPNQELNIIFAVLLGFLLLLTLWQAYWAAQRSESPQQAVGHGIAVAIGISITYGLLVLLFAPTSLWIKLGFFLGLIGVGWWGGQIAGQNLHKAKRTPPPFAVPGPLPGPMLSSTPNFGMGPLPPIISGGNPDIVYNMGVSAAMGGRPDEARQHFNRVLQMNPRYLPAWLQLANLAPTPEEAWDYIQQARALNPADPAVVQAVGVIWPQVARRAKANETPASSSSDLPVPSADNVPSFDPNSDSDTTEPPAPPPFAG